MLREVESKVPAAPAFILPNALADLRVAASVVLDDWNSSQLLNPLIRNTMAQQYWRASLSVRLAHDDYIGAALVVFAACVGTDLTEALSPACIARLDGEPVGLMVTPEDGQRMVLEMYAIMRAEGCLSELLDQYDDSAMGNPCHGMGCMVAKYIGVHDSHDPILKSIDYHVRIMAAVLAVAGTA